MHKEIDRSEQSKWSYPGILLYIAMLGLVWVRLSCVPEGTDISHTRDLTFLFTFGPIVALTLGSLIGILRKRAIRINTDWLDFNDESRAISEFGELYHEEQFETCELAGYTSQACFLFILIVFSLIIGGVIASIFVIVNDIIPLALLFVLMIVLYPAGVKFAYHTVSISSSLVSNPLVEKIWEDLSKEEAISRMSGCELVDSIHVEYRTGTGQNLRVILDIHVILITSTDPPFTVRIPTENMQYGGPEFTCLLESISTRDREEVISVEGRTAFLSVENIKIGTLISIRYDGGCLGLLFEDTEKCCNLLDALLNEVKKHVPFKVVPKKSKSSDEY